MNRQLNTRRRTHAAGARVAHLLLVLVLLAAGLGPASAGAQAQAADWDIAGGHFFTQAGGGGGRGFAVTDAGDVRFWAEFRRLGGVDAVGYPASQRFAWDGFTVQVFQRVVFQWRPEAQQAYFVNVFDRLDQLGKNPWLLDVRQTPPPQAWSEAGLAWPQVVAARLAVLDAYPAIRAKYDDVVGDPIEANGLPVSAVVDMGNHYALRAQRVVFQQWKQAVPWAAAGQVTVALGGDIAKEAGVLPDPAALLPALPGAPTAPVVGGPAPAATPPASPPVVTGPAPAPAVAGWTAGPDMPTARSGLGVAAHANGKIYAIGGGPSSVSGGAGVGLLDTVEEFDPAANAGQGAWATRQPMPTKRSYLAAVAHSNGKIYALGGLEGPTSLPPVSSCNHTGYSAKVEEFDPAANNGMGAWATRQPMLGPRAYLAAVEASDGKIYVFGGNAGCYRGYGGPTHIFDPAANGGMGLWTVRAPTPLGPNPDGGESPGAAATPDGRIYVMGGFSLTDRSAWLYTLATNMWTRIPILPTTRQQLGVAAHANGRIYAIGGFQRSTGATYQDTVEEWDPSGNSGAGAWNTRPGMPLGGRAGLGVAAHPNGAIYAIGGSDAANTRLNRVEKFTP